MPSRLFFKIFRRGKAQGEEVHPPRRGLPLYAYILYGVALVALAVYVAARCSPAFAAGFNGTVGAFFRTVMAYLTGWLPFSLAEVLVFSSPAVVVGFCVYACRRRCDTWRSTLLFLGSFFSVVSVFFSLFVFTFGTGYFTEPLDRRVGLETGGVSVEELAVTAEKLVSLVNEAAEEVDFGEDGFSRMPHTLPEMNRLLLAAYEPVTHRYSFLQPLRSRLKPVMASKAMSYSHITGVYTYFTGEANLNVYFPDYTLPFTAAHELAHQRGVARENEANFVAFLVCTASEDAYIRYCGYLNLLEYVAAALARADGEVYREVMGGLREEVWEELLAYADFFDAFRDSAVADLSGTVNDTYLKVNGSTAGVGSYGLVVDLAVSYFQNEPSFAP